MSGSGVLGRLQGSETFSVSGQTLDGYERKSRSAFSCGFSVPVASRVSPSPFITTRARDDTSASLASYAEESICSAK